MAAPQMPISEMLPQQTTTISLRGGVGIHILGKAAPCCNAEINNELSPWLSVGGLLAEVFRDTIAAEDFNEDEAAPLALHSSSDSTAIVKGCAVSPAPSSVFPSGSTEPGSGSPSEADSDIDTSDDEEGDGLCEFSCLAQDQPARATILSKEELEFEEQGRRWRIVGQRLSAVFSVAAAEAKASRTLGLGDAC